MISKKITDKKKEVVFFIYYPLFIICILLLIERQSAAEESYNNIKAKIEGDTTTFTIEVRDAEVRDVLRALAQQNNLNIIIGEEVKTKATFNLNDITFKDALEIITKVNGLNYVIQNNVLWIGARENIAMVGGDMVMEIVRLNYSKATEIVGQLKGVLTDKGSAIPDSRTNSLILRDLKRNIEDAKLLIKSLDTRTMQVVIEARIIEAQSNFARDLGVQWGLTGMTSSKDQYNTAFGSTSATPSPVWYPTGYVGSGGAFSAYPNYAVNLPASGAVGGLGAFGFSLGKLTGDPLLLDLRISAGEKSGKLKIVSQPKITTLNNTAATIHSGLTFKVKITTTTGATTTTGLQDVSTGIDLQVTPQISADDFVNLSIVASKSDPDFGRSVDGVPGVSEKRASTSVLVKDGETTVIGGLYKSISSDAENAIPYLSKIPIIGWLFKSNSKYSDSEELLVFITPRIVRYNEEKNITEITQ